jgi:acetyl esterase/lipase
MPHPPLDPLLEQAIAKPELASWAVPMTADRIDYIRERMRADEVDPSQLTRDGRVLVNQVKLPAAEDGFEIDLLVLRPRNITAPRPAILHTHGGGLVAGSRWFSADLLAKWVDLLGVVGFAVEYRLPPEYPYPAAVNDCHRALAHLVEHAEEYGVDPRAVILWGQSAGGGMAAATALMAVSAGGPAVAGLVMEAPMLDDRNQLPSTFELVGDGYIWGRTSNLTAWKAYLGSACGTHDVPATAAPNRAEDLTGMPPTYMHVGQVDLFRDETLEFAAKLSRSGVPTELHLWPGCYHGFQILVPEAAVAEACNERTFDYLRRTVNRLSEPSAIE